MDVWKSSRQNNWTNYCIEIYRKKHGCLLIQQTVLITSELILHSLSNILVWVPRCTLYSYSSLSTIHRSAGLIALMELLAVLSSASDHQPQVTCSRWWQWYAVVNLLMWKPDSSLIIILSPASACTEHMWARLCWQSAHFYAPCSLKGRNQSHRTVS